MSTHLNYSALILFILEIMILELVIINFIFIILTDFFYILNALNFLNFILILLNN